MQQPKYKIDDKVYVVINNSEEIKHPCPACEDGLITLKDGEKYHCPRCYGTGTDTEFVWRYAADPKPRYVTGIHFDAQKHGKRGVHVDCEYYLMDNIDPLHSVYTDSGGDERKNESQLHPTFEEAEKAAAAEQKRQEEEQRKEEEERKERQSTKRSR
jgi:hypothetical protein